MHICTRNVNESVRFELLCELFLTYIKTESKAQIVASKQDLQSQGIEYHFFKKKNGRVFAFPPLYFQLFVD